LTFATLLIIGGRLGDVYGTGASSSSRRPVRHRLATGVDLALGRHVDPREALIEGIARR